MEITKEGTFRFLLRLTELIELTKTKHRTWNIQHRKKSMPQPQSPNRKHINNPQRYRHFFIFPRKNF